MVVFGGYYWTTSEVYLNDTWALSLEGGGSWSQLMPTGDSPSGRRDHSAVYDPIRNRMVVYGGFGLFFDQLGMHKRDLDDTWGLDLGGAPAWTRLAGAGGRAGRRSLHLAIYDPARDRMLVSGGQRGGNMVNDDWTLSWEAPLAAGVSCPGDVVWSPGASLPLSYEIENPYSFTQTADYTLVSERDWPGFPITGSLSLGPASADIVPLSVPVPDSAVAGLDALAFTATLRAIPQITSCSHHLHDASTPTLLALIAADAQPDRVRLRWYGGANQSMQATLYRRTAATPWELLAVLIDDASGVLSYEDRAVHAGLRYGYRLGYVEGATEVFTPETWVEVPATFRFALAVPQPNPAVSGHLSVSFSLPDAVPARMEVYDLGGRRVWSHSLSAEPGSHVLDVPAAGCWAAGVYWLRLAQGLHTATVKFVLAR